MNKDEFQNTSSGNGRKLFLVLVLLVVLGVFGYDYFVAKPAYQEGIKKLQAMLDPQKDDQGEAIMENGMIMKIGDLDKDGYVTQEDVRKLMGREPKSTVTEEETTIVETYAWPRGIPLMTYDAYAVYYKDADKTTLKKVTESKPELKKPQTIAQKDRPAGLTLSAGNPADDKAADDKATDDKAADDKSADDKSAEDKAAEDKAAEDKAAEDKKESPAEGGGEGN